MQFKNCIFRRRRSANQSSEILEQAVSEICARCKRCFSWKRAQKYDEGISNDSGDSERLKEGNARRGRTKEREQARHLLRHERAQLLQRDEGQVADGSLGLAASFAASFAASLAPSLAPSFAPNLTIDLALNLARHLAPDLAINLDLAIHLVFNLALDLPLISKRLARSIASAALRSNWIPALGARLWMLAMLLVSALRRRAREGSPELNLVLILHTHIPKSEQFESVEEQKTNQAREIWHRFTISFDDTT
eukprot:3785634-Pleurochrysis_carterae.AAC.1